MKVARPKRTVIRIAADEYPAGHVQRDDDGCHIASSGGGDYEPQAHRP